MRAVVTALTLAALLATGCTGDSEDPPAVATTDPATESPTAAEESPDPSGEATEEPEAVVGGVGSGATFRVDCGTRVGYGTGSKTVEVNREVRFGDISVVGSGRLIGTVTIAALASRGPDEGMLVIGDERGYGRSLMSSPGWDSRVPLQGRLVQPGRYVVFLQLGLGPGDAAKGVEAAWFDSNGTGSVRLGFSLKARRQCGE